MKKITLLLALMLTSGVFAQFSEGFDAALTLPAGWTTINGGDANTWGVIDLSASTLLPHSPTNIIGIGYSSTAHDDYLVAPAITVTAGVNDYVSFFGRSRDPLYPETIDVKISTAGATATDFTITALANVAPPSGATFTKYGVDLSAYVGQTIYVAFYSSTTDMFYFDIDDVVNGPIPTCFAPTDVAISNITETSATVNYSAPATATNFQIEYGPSGFALGTGTTLTATGTFPVDITGLTSGTSYDVYIRTDCGNNDFSEWISASFTTVPTAPANDVCDTAIALTPAADFAIGAVNSTTVGASVGTLIPDCQPNVAGDVWFTVVAPADGNITIETGPVANSTNNDTVLVAYTGTCGALIPLLCDDDSSANGFFSLLQLTGLTAGSTIYVQALQYSSPFGPSTPGAFQISAYSATLATKGFQTDAFSYYPNPVSNVLNVSYNQKISDISIYNMLGQNVLNQTIGANDAKVDVSSLAQGNYIAKVVTENGTQTIKIVKE